MYNGEIDGTPRVYTGQRRSPSEKLIIITMLRGHDRVEITIIIRFYFYTRPISIQTVKYAYIRLKFRLIESLFNAFTLIWSDMVTDQLFWLVLAIMLNFWKTFSQYIPNKLFPKKIIPKKIEFLKLTDTYECLKTKFLPT